MLAWSVGHLIGPAVRTSERASVKFETIFSLVNLNFAKWEKKIVKTLWMLNYEARKREKM